MHPFCRELKECIPELLTDPFASTAVLNGFEEILATEHMDVSVSDLIGRILNVLLDHPLIRCRFRAFIPVELTRGGPRTPADLPSLQELFETLHLVKNTTVQAQRVTDDDLAAEIVSQANATQNAILGGDAGRTK